MWLVSVQFWQSFLQSSLQVWCPCVSPQSVVEEPAMCSGKFCNFPTLLNQKYRIVFLSDNATYHSSITPTLNIGYVCRLIGLIQGHRYQYALSCLLAIQSITITIRIIIVCFTVLLITAIHICGLLQCASLVIRIWPSNIHADCTYI